MLVGWHPCHRFPAVFSNAVRFASCQPLQSPSGCWQVSSYGRCRDTRGVVTPGSLAHSGYRRVGIGEQIWSVHRIVKITFHGLPLCNQAWQVHHCDGDRANNHINNLEYVTNSQNAQYSHESPSRKHGRSNSKPVWWRAVGSQSWTLCSSAASAAEQLGMHRSTVAKSCRDSLPVKGFEFQYHNVSEPDLTGEEWLPMRDPASGEEVAGRRVSSCGRVTTQHGRVHYGHVNRSGYSETTVSIHGRARTELVHRLVAFSFLGAPPTPLRRCINHKDSNRSNNARENLEWVTHAENMAHYYSTNAVAVGQNRGSKPVWSRAYSSDEWTWHPSLSSAASSLGIQLSAVSRCAHGKMCKTGVEFRFAVSPAKLTLPGEEWRDVDLVMLLKDRERRMRANLRL